MFQGGPVGRLSDLSGPGGTGGFDSIGHYPYPCPQNYDVIAPGSSLLPIAGKKEYPQEASRCPRIDDLTMRRVHVYFAGTYDSDIVRISELLFSTTRRDMTTLGGLSRGASSMDNCQIHSICCFGPFVLSPAGQ
jgi:hypothetical protein